MPRGLWPLAICVPVLASLAFTAEPAPEQKGTAQSDKPREMTLSAAAQKAVAKYMDIILDDPRNEFAFDQVYSIYESEQMTWKLLDFFLNAARLQRESGNPQVLVGLTYYRFRDYFKAAEHFTNALKLMPNDFYCRLMLGRVYLKQADSDKARANLAEAVKVASGIEDRVEALLLLGEALMLGENRDEALKAWTEVLELQRYDIPTLQRLARIYREHKLRDKADQMYREILELCKKNPQLSCETLLDRAELQVENGDRKAAIGYLRQAQGLLLPGSALRQEVEVRIRHLYREDGRLEEFFQEVEKRVTERPNDVAVRMEAARLYAEENRLKDALTHLEQALARDSRAVALLEDAVDLYARAGQEARAAELLDRLYEITGGAPAYLVRKGDILWEHEKKQEAVEAWTRIVSGEAPGLRRYEAVARAYRTHDLKDEAVSLYRKMIEMEPTAQDIRLSFADYLLSLNRKDEATKVLTPLVESADTPASVFLQIAELYSNHELNDLLLSVLQRARELYPNDHRILKSLGLALEGAQKYDDAIDAFYQAYDRAPNWREREIIIDKLISLHLAYGKPTDGRNQVGGVEGLGNLVLKIHKDMKADPESPEPYMALARICSVSRPTAETRFQSPPIYVKGLSELTPQKTDEFPMGPMPAITYYTQALDRAPTRIDAYEGMARSFMLFDEFERAVLEYKKLAVVNPVGKWKYYFTIGDFFASQGQMPEARAFWGRVAERSFTDATLYFRLGTRYYWADRPEQAIGMLRKAISLHPDEYRYHLALGNILADRKDFAQAIHEYREALRLSTQSMLLPVRRTMSEVQIKYAHTLFTKEQYKQALDVYEEVARFQEVMNQHLGTTVPEYPDVQVQIARTRARLTGKSGDAQAYREIGAKFPGVTCWVTDHLRMAIDYLAEKEAAGFAPRQSVPMAASAQRPPTIKEGLSVRVYPWVYEAAISPSRLLLLCKSTEIELDPGTGKQLAVADRKGYVHYLDESIALRTFDGKLSLSEISTGKLLWEAKGDWGRIFEANSTIAIGTNGQNGPLQALDLKNGSLVWQAPPCADFSLTEKYVALKRLKQGKGLAPGSISLEEYAYGDAQAIGYIFQVLDAATGKVVFQSQSTGTHYWCAPVIVGERVLLTDEFDHVVFAHDIATGKLQWRAEFDSFFAAPPLVMDGRVYLYMRIPKQKTIIQYALDPDTGDILHATDLRVNSLYAKPIAIGSTLFFYDPVAYELITVDRNRGGVTGRQSVVASLSEVSKRNVITLQGLRNHIFFYTWDGLVVRLDVAEQ